MPFTPAHPAIVLPLLRRARLSAIGLIVGSMVPDFEYFFKMRVNSHYSHTLGGLFYFDVPVSFLLAWIFIRLVRDNLVANLPSFLQRRLQPVLMLDTRRVLSDRALIFAVSALIGSVSHLFWDGFTHNDTFFVRNISFYHGSYVPYEGVKYPLWYALQHISTAVGLIVLIIYVFRMPQAPGTVWKPNLIYWMVVVAVAAIVVTIRFMIWPYDDREGNIIVSSISGICCGVIAAGMINFNNVAQEANQKDG
jgi:hypothetical protein